MAEWVAQPWRLVQNKVRGEGGREIDRFRGVANPQDTPGGSEAWIGSATRAFNAPKDDPDMGLSRVVLPDGSDWLLADAIARDPKAVLGLRHMARHGTELGVLIKYLDAKKQYTLQAHPTPALARELWGSDIGKQESWHVLGLRADSAAPPYIYLGFKPGVTREMFEALVRAGDMPGLLALCHQVPVAPGETYYVGGGVPHALGAGCFVLEVQEPSDLTVVPLPQRTLMARMFAGTDEADWPLEDEALYEEKMLRGFVYEGVSWEENLRLRKGVPQVIAGGPWGSEALLVGPRHTDAFALTRAQLQGSAPLFNTGFPSVAIVESGSGQLRFEGGSLDIKKADELFLPWDIPGAVVAGELTLLRCHPGGVSWPEDDGTNKTCHAKNADEQKTALAE